MPPLAIVLVLASAFLHASWNVLLARVPRGLDATTVALALGLVAWSPLAVARWRVQPAVWPYVACSAAFELAYFAVLNRAYARAPAHATYPVARGLAPVLLLPAAVLAGAHLSGRIVVAVLAISAGVTIAARGSPDRRALAYAVPVACCIAGYTLVDSRGLRHADPATYLWLSMAPVVVGLLAVRAVAGDGVRALRAELRPATFVVGLGVFGAYGLTLAALALVSTAGVPAVAALRETGILLVIALSWPTATGQRQRPTGQRQRPTRGTALGAVLVFAGVAMLAVR